MEPVKRIAYLTGFFLVITYKASSAFVPSNIPEMVCYSSGICDPDERCALKRRLLSAEKGVKYTGKVESHAICGSLQTYVKCPEGNHTVCSEDRKCYAYEASDISDGVNVLEMRVKKPRGVVSSSSDVECRTKYKNDACLVFEENAESIGFVAGFPSSCAPKTKYISENGAFLPSFHSTIVCEYSYLCKGTDSCQFRAILESNDVERFSTGLWFTISCSDLQTDIYCASVNNRSMCSVETKCYTYYSPSQSFNVMELDIKKPNDVNGSQVECKASNGDCALFKETSSQMIFISGLQRNCFPRAGDFTEGTDYEKE